MDVSSSGHRRSSLSIVSVNSGSRNEMPVGIWRVAVLRDRDRIKGFAGDSVYELLFEVDA